MKEREHTHYQMINCRSLLPFVFFSVCFPVKVSHFTMFSFLDYKKVDYEKNCFSLTPDVISTRTKKKCATVSNNRY